MKPLTGMCESCMMPFKKDPKGANREHEKYCSYCYANGALTYPGTDVNEFKKDMYAGMVAHGTNKFAAYIYTFLAGFAPRWKNK